MPYKLLDLAEEQKQFVRANLINLPLTEMVRALWPDVKDESGRQLDGRSTQGRSVKAFVVSEGLSIKTREIIPVGPLELTADQKRLVEKLAPQTESILELTQSIFNDATIKPMSQQYRAIWSYCKEVYPQGISPEEEPVEEKIYEAPPTLQVLVGQLNLYVSTGDSNAKLYNWGKLKMVEERQLRALMSHLRVLTFTQVASQYELKPDREQFVSTFMRWAYDKPDLTQIEVDQMILAAAERVNITQIERLIQRIEKMQKDLLEGGGEVDENGKKRKFGMTDVELINGIRTKHDAAKGRFTNLMEKLETNRSKRQESIEKRSSSFVNLVQEVMKDEEKREQLAALGQAEHAADAQEVNRIKDMDDMMAIIAGQSLSEAAKG